MIVPMMRVTVLGRERDRVETLKELRRLGVLHIQSVRPPSSDRTAEIERRIADLDRALVLIGANGPGGPPGTKMPDQVIDEALDLQVRRETLTAEIEELREIRDWFDAWGRVSPASLRVLREAGVDFRFFRTSRAALKALDPAIPVRTIAEGKEGTLWAWIGRPGEEPPDFPETRVPQVEPDDADARFAAAETARSGIDDALKALTLHAADLKAHRARLVKALEMSAVLAGMGIEPPFAYVQGFCPVDRVDGIKRSAEAKGWGYLIDEPDDPSEVPTLIRTSKVPRLVQPLFAFMGTLPGYREYDISLVFLAFFSLFYAMIIGDAGYGLIFLAAALGAARLMKRAPREPFHLLILLSVATIIWGLITGTWFGSKALGEIPVLRMFVIDGISSFHAGPEGTTVMMRFTFILGVLHLTIARLMALARKWPSLTAFAEAGWILILWSVFFVANQLVLGREAPGFMFPMLISGIVIAALFANPRGRMLRGFLPALANLPLSVISSFSDIVSYIRLFAVGVATVTVAASFNEMAGGILAPLILVFGHGLNILLGLMSVLVHGVRLNMLEFSGHLGQQWSGKAYLPFTDDDNIPSERERSTS